MYHPSDIIIIVRVFTCDWQLDLLVQSSVDSSKCPKRLTIRLYIRFFSLLYQQQTFFPVHQARFSNNNINKLWNEFD